MAATCHAPLPVAPEDLRGHHGCPQPVAVGLGDQGIPGLCDHEKRSLRDADEEAEEPEVGQDRTGIERDARGRIDLVDRGGRAVKPPQVVAAAQDAEGRVRGRPAGVGGHREVHGGVEGQAADADRRLRRDGTDVVDRRAAFGQPVSLVFIRFASGTVAEPERRDSLQNVHSRQDPPSDLGQTRARHPRRDGHSIACTGHMRHAAGICQPPSFDLRVPRKTGPRTGREAASLSPDCRGGT